jgi:hypothetical protein
VQYGSVEFNAFAKFAFGSQAPEPEFYQHRKRLSPKNAEKIHEYREDSKKQK